VLRIAPSMLISKSTSMTVASGWSARSPSQVTLPARTHSPTKTCCRSPRIGARGTVAHRVAVDRDGDLYPTYTLASDRGSGLDLAGAVGRGPGNVVVLVPIALNLRGTRYGFPIPSSRARHSAPRREHPAILRRWSLRMVGIQRGSAAGDLQAVRSDVAGIATPAAIPAAFVGLNTGECSASCCFWAMNVWIVIRGMDSIKFLETWGSPFLLAVELRFRLGRGAAGGGPDVQNPAFGGCGPAFDQRVGAGELGCCVLGNDGALDPDFHATRGVSAIRCWQASASGRWRSSPSSGRRHQRDDGDLRTASPIRSRCSRASAGR